MAALIFASQLQFCNYFSVTSKIISEAPAAELGKKTPFFVSL